MPQLDAVRAVLFGRVYEAIIANYFKYVEGYNVYDREITVYVNWLEHINNNTTKKLRDAGYGEILNQIFVKFKEKLEEIRSQGKQRFNIDLVVEKKGNYYIVEMQAWPVWLKQRYHSSKLTWKVILSEDTALIPRVLAKKVKVKGRPLDVYGFYYVAFSRSEDHDSIERFFKMLTEREFKLFYVDEIIEVSKDYDWYKELIRRIKSNIEEFLNALMEGKILF